MGRCPLSFEETLRAIVREEVRSALSDAKPAPAPKLYTLAQLAKAGSLSPTSLRRLRTSGHLVAVGRGRMARYSFEALAVALANAEAPVEPVKQNADRILKSVKGGKR